MLQELVLPTNIDEAREADLGHDCSELAGSGRDTVASGSVTSREDFAGNDEGGGVRAEVLEEVGHAVEEHEGLLAARSRLHLVVTEAHGAKDDSKKGEAHELDGLTAPRVDEEKRGVVAWDETTDGEDKVPDGNVVQSSLDVELLDLAVTRGTEADGGENGGGVKTKTVKGDVEGEPRPGGAEEDLSVPPLAKMACEVGPCGSGQLGALVVVDRVNNVGTVGKVGVHILRGLLDVALDVHGVSRGLGDGETEVERGSSRDTADTDDNTPALVNSAHVGKGLVPDGALVCGDDNDGDDTRHNCGRSARLVFAQNSLTVPPSLRREHRGHHAASNATGSELRGDYGGKRVVTPNTHSPESESV